jgi:hypothetical protein
MIEIQVPSFTIYWFDVTTSGFWVGYFVVAALFMIRLCVYSTRWYGIRQTQMLLFLRNSPGRIDSEKLRNRRSEDMDRLAYEADWILFMTLIWPISMAYIIGLRMQDRGE